MIIIIIKSKNTLLIICYKPGLLHCMKKWPHGLICLQGLKVFVFYFFWLKMFSCCCGFKTTSDIHCNRSATSPRPKFKTIAEVAEDSQLGFAFGHRLVGDWSATNRGLVADWSATGRRPRGDHFATWCNWSPIGRRLSQLKTDKRDDFGFPIVNFPWLSGDVPRLPSYSIYISQLVRFARCCTSVLDFHYKNLRITSKLLTQGYRYHKLRKTFGKFFRSYTELLSKFGDISFQEYVFKGISHPVFYGDLVYKLRRVKDTQEQRWPSG